MRLPRRETWTQPIIPALLMAAAAACGGGSKMPAPTAPSDPVSQAPPPGVILYPPPSSCELSYASPGAYTLNADVGSPTANPASCILIATSGVTLDCAAHAVTGFVLVGQGSADVTIRNCTATGIAPVIDASNLIVENNRLATSLYFNTAHDVIVRANRISGRPGATAVVAFSRGHGNRIVQNTIDGGGSRGADDGIVVANEIGDTIQGNAIADTFDAGIEGIDALTDTLIADNTISHTVTAAIGSYWCTDWQHVTIRDNRFAGVRAGIRVEYSKDGRCDGWGSAPDPNFSHVEIAGNILDSSVPATTPAISVKLDAAAPSVAGNVLRGNDFGPSPVDLHPLEGFENGGGNICGPAGNFRC